MSIPDGLIPQSLVGRTDASYTEPFWTAATRGALVVQHCSSCRAERWPPAPLCWRCRSTTSTWEEHDGQGHIYSFTIIRHAVVSGIADVLPISVVLVELDGKQDIRVCANGVGDLREKPVVGAAVTLTFVTTGSGIPQLVAEATPPTRSPHGS